MPTKFTFALSLLLFSTLTIATPNPSVWVQFDTPVTVDQILNNQGITAEIKPIKIDSVNLTGGEYWHLQSWSKQDAKPYVLDFQNTSVIETLNIWFFKASELVSYHESGASKNITDFGLRHGVPTPSQPGDYQIIIKMSSPFYLANPVPYIEDEKTYKQNIKPGNFYVVFGLGIFFALFFYNAFIALQSNDKSSLYYSLFILGNIIYNANALQVLPQFFGINIFWLTSFPILLSNIAYIHFVQDLLNIRQNNKMLYNAGIALAVLMASFIPIALLFPNWSLELARYGVAIFSLYGFTSGILIAKMGSSTAKYYLIANIMFIVPAIISISLTGLGTNKAFFIEHLGLFAVNIECLLLALVIANRFHQIENERENLLNRVQAALKIAHSDSLTGLKNRLAFTNDLLNLPDNFKLAVIDLDNLKICNDQFGHAEGDRLLVIFSEALFHSLKKGARLYRLGGDEFVILSRHCSAEEIQSWVNKGVDVLKSSGFKQAGASMGIAHYSEVNDTNQLFELADKRMYANKTENKALALEPS